MLHRIWLQNNNTSSNRKHQLTKLASNNINRTQSTQSGVVYKNEHIMVRNKQEHLVKTDTGDHITSDSSVIAYLKFFSQNSTLYLPFCVSTFHNPSFPAPPVCFPLLAVLVLAFPSVSDSKTKALTLENI